MTKNLWITWVFMVLYYLIWSIEFYNKLCQGFLSSDFVGDIVLVSVCFYVGVMVYDRVLIFLLYMG